MNFQHLAKPHVTNVAGRRGQMAMSRPELRGIVFDGSPTQTLREGMAMKKQGVFLLGMVIAVSVAGCATPGANLASNVYRADQVNTRQEARVVNILMVQPAKVEVSNAQAKRSAEVLGGLLGAVSGAVLGNNLGGDAVGRQTLGAVGGGAAGAVVGSLTPGKVLVNGVSITYDEGGQTFNSAQVGQPCQFQAGHAVVISTSPTETRIQPNATCPTVARAK